MPFLGLLEICGAEKGHAFGARVWISMPFLGFLEKATARKRASSLRFQNGDEENCCLI